MAETLFVEPKNGSKKIEVLLDGNAFPELIEEYMGFEARKYFESNYHYDSIYIDRSDDGYDEREAKGYDVGYDDGYDDGYDVGYDVGYDNGYDEGLRCGKNDKNAEMI